MGHSFRLCHWFIILVFLGSLNPVALFAQGAMVKDIAVINSNTDLLLYFRVDNAFTPEMKEGVKNGIPITFTFFVTLTETRKGWPDKEIQSHTFEQKTYLDILSSVSILHGRRLFPKRSSSLSIVTLLRDRTGSCSVVSTKQTVSISPHPSYLFTVHNLKIDSSATLVRNQKREVSSSKSDAVLLLATS